MNEIPVSIALMIASIVAAPTGLHLQWDPTPDAACYAVQETPTLAPANFNTVALITNTEAWMTPSFTTGFYRALSVDTNGLNSLGGYEF